MQLSLTFCLVSGGSPKRSNQKIQSSMPAITIAQGREMVQICSGVVVSPAYLHARRVKSQK